ncbi:SDR family NAD(P)-dependent oxidoreductase [Streptomyces sp. CA-106131]
MKRLVGKVALITGTAAGMGAAHARLFAEEGAKVIATDIRVDGGGELTREFRDEVLYLQHDVSDPASWESVVARGKEAFGPITVLVNNAGIAGPNAFTADISIEDYLRTVAVDEHGIFYGMRAVIPGMIEAGGGSIVNISSVAGFAHAPGTPNIAYAASKAAVRGMTKAAAVEYAGQGIRVNSVHPGGVMTEMMATQINEEQKEMIASLVPMGRMAESVEVSRPVLFLASDESSYMSGSEIIVDGGMLAK